MNKHTLEVAIAEAKRFKATAEKALVQHDKHFVMITGTKETAACRRASMDLTRALAELRKHS